MSQPTIENLTRHERLQRWAPGQILFREGDEPRGVYVLHSGEVDLTFASRKGNVKPLRVAAAGQMLALSSVVGGRPHDCSAVARTSCRVGFIERDEFLRTLDESPAIWFSVLRMLSSDINAAYDDMRNLAVR